MRTPDARGRDSHGTPPLHHRPGLVEREPFAALLHHQLGSDPLPLTLVKHLDGGWGVALVLDGWYAGEADAQAVLEGYWREVVRAAVDAARVPRP